MKGDVIKVLDHGEVQLIDFMGDDYRILQSARVSTGGEAQKGDKEDRGLIRYLYKNQHLSPFEQVQFTFRVKCPIFVARQWFRHRAFCISGDSIVHLKNLEKMKIEDLYRLQTIGLPFSFSGQVWSARTQFDLLNDDNIYNCKEVSKLLNIGNKELRRLVKKYCPIDNRKSGNLNIKGSHYKKLFNMIIDGDISHEFNIKSITKNVKFLDHDGFFNYTPVYKIFRNGMKEMYEIELENGKKLTSTLEHNFLTNSGYKTLKEICNPSITKTGKTIWENHGFELATNGESVWRDKNYLQSFSPESKTFDQLSIESKINPATLKKWLKIHEIKCKKEKNIPWNAGKTYKLGERETTELWKQKNHEVRSGEKSNWWKGGIAKRRLDVNYDNWVASIRNNILEKYNYKCALCGSHENLHLHHIIPFYMDEGKLKDEKNLIPICKSCHTKRVNNHEEEYIEFFQNKTNLILDDLDRIKNKISKRKNEIIQKRSESRKRVKWSKINNITYVGMKESFDLGIENEQHNYVVNGFVTHNSYNEYSGRYSEMIDDMFVPESFRVQGIKNHQGSGDPLIKDVNDALLIKIKAEYYDLKESYDDMINLGVARELARVIMPVANYTEFYFTGDLRNLFHFLELRLHDHAQYEIKVFAEAILQILKEIPELKWSVEIFEEMREINYLLLSCIDKEKDLSKIRDHLKSFL